MSANLRKLLLCGLMALASIFGAPIRAEEIEKLLRYGRETKVVYTIDGDEEGNNHRRPGRAETE
jgi:hypothetical protein